jgi:hypothetical protein
MTNAGPGQSVIDAALKLWNFQGNERHCSCLICQQTILLHHGATLRAKYPDEISREYAEDYVNTDVVGP